MGLTPARLRASRNGGGGDAGGDGALFRYEVRRDGIPVVRLEGLPQADGSVVVEATVTPVGKGPEAAIARPFVFAHPEHARHFADEALESLEFLGCDVVA